MNLMENGMDEFIYKSKMINYGQEENIEKLLHSAVLGGENTINRKIFSQNLEKKIVKLKRELGIDIKKLLEQI